MGPLVSLQREVEDIRDAGKNRDELMAKMNVMVSETHAAITGNQQLGHVGIAQRLVVAERSIRDLWSDKMKMIGAYSVITVVALIIGPILAALAKHYFGF